MPRMTAAFTASRLLVSMIGLIFTPAFCSAESKMARVVEPGARTIKSCPSNSSIRMARRRASGWLAFATIRIRCLLKKRLKKRASRGSQQADRFFLMTEHSARDRHQELPDFGQFNSAAAAVKQLDLELVFQCAN